MSLNCVIGEAIYDKDKYIYSKATDMESQGFSPVIFVPSQARMTAEEAFFNITKKRGMINTSITTLSRYISNTLEKTNITKKYITDEEKRIYIKQIINNNRESLTLFNKIIDKPSFVDLIISYIDCIKRENLKMEDVDNVDNVGDLTKEKIKEIFNIALLVSEKMSEKYIDSLDILDIFNEFVDNNREIFNKQEMLFHGYNNFSKKELSIIRSFLKAGANITVSLTLKPELIRSNQEEEGIFEIPLKTYKELNKIARECGVTVNNILDLEKIETKEDIEFLTKNIFLHSYSKYNKKSDNVVLRVEKNANYEIETIAQDILQKTRENTDIRFKDFAIYTSNFEEYEFCIKRILREYNIEYNFDDASDLRLSNLSVYILMLLKIASDNKIDITTLFILLKTGLCDISEEDLAYFENYINEFGIKGYMLTKQFTKNNKEQVTYGIYYDLNKLNDIRENVVSGLLNIVDEFNMEMDAKTIVEKLYSHLKENNVIDRYILEINTTSSFSLKQGDLKRQVVNAIYELFDNIVMACGQEKISICTFRELFEFGLKDKKIKTIPMLVDQVEICDINKTKILPKKYVYFIGAYDNGLPLNSEEDVMFSDNELKQLKESNIELKQDSITRTNMALYNVYLSLATVKEKLHISMPASKIAGEPLRMGRMLNEVKRILELEVLGDCIDKEYDINLLKMTNDVVFKKMLENMVNLENEREENIDIHNLHFLYNIYTHYIKNNSNEKYKEILEYSRKDNNLSKEVLDKLYGNNITSSVSKLENFQKCPFSYFVNYVLNVKPLKKYSMNVVDLGTLMHDVLEQFSKWLLERSYLWQQIVNDEKVQMLSREKLDSIIEKIFSEKYSKYNDNSRYIFLKASLKKKMFNVIKIIAQSLNQSEFKPLGYEIEFKAGGLYSPIEINLENGKTMFLLGKIDRVDTSCINDKIYVRIVDYKSSKKNLALEDIKEGISLQLMTYMSAIINNSQNIDKEKEVIPAALNYFSLKTNIKKMPEYESDIEKINKEIIKEMKLKGIYLSDVKVLENLDRKYTDSGSSYIDINNRNIKTKALSEEMFKEECENIKKILKNIGNEIVKGVVSIKPRKCNGVLPCEYCDYLAVCRKDIRA